MWLFKASEIAKIAMNMEKNGQAFYRALEELAKDAETKALFTFLMKEEEEHYQIFEKLFTKLASYEIPESYKGEYEDYLRELVESNIFARDINVVELARKMKSPIEAIDFALGTEKDSIVFYSQFKKIMPAEEHFMVDQIIGEENRHLQRLLMIRKAVVKTPEEFFIPQEVWVEME